MRYMYFLASVHRGIPDCAVYVFFSVSSSRNPTLCGICIFLRQFIKESQIVRYMYFLASVHQGIPDCAVYAFFSVSSSRNPTLCGTCIF